MAHTVSSCVICLSILHKLADCSNRDLDFHLSCLWHISRATAYIYVHECLNRYFIMPPMLMQGLPHWWVDFSYVGWKYFVIVLCVETHI